MLPGKTEIDRAAMRSCADGERAEAHHASRERRGITRESVWIQQTPGGDFAVIYMEADDLQVAMGGANGFAPPEQIIDFRVSRTRPNQRALST
jgi:hypothetical protein